MANAIIISIITVLLAFGGIYAVFGKTIKTVKTNTEGLACRSTLEAQNFTRDKWYITTFAERCKTLDKTLPLSKKTETKDEFMKEIADLIARTWWTIGEGKIKNLWGETDSSIFRGDSCFIRYAINFKKGETFNTSREELEKYLFSTKYRSFDDVPYTYEEYIYSYAGKGALIILPQATPDKNMPLGKSIRAGTVYAISVVSATPDSWFVRVETKFISAVLEGPVIALLHTTGLIDTDLYDLVKADLNTKNTIIVFSTLDYAQKEMECSYI